MVGLGIGVFGLFNRGEMIACFGHRRLREKPPSGGVSVFRESIPVDQELKDDAIRLLQPLRWHGVAMLEYKLDERVGKPVLIEVNGRFWGSLQLGIDAGVDFPYLLYRLATENHAEVQQAYRTGVKSRWLLGDLDHTLLRIFKRERDLHLPSGFPSRLETLIQFLRFYQPGMHYEVLSLRDPRPLIYECSMRLPAFTRARKDSRWSRSANLCF